jgi:hypothetical protein
MTQTTARKATRKAPNIETEIESEIAELVAKPTPAQMIAAVLAEAEMLAELDSYEAMIDTRRLVAAAQFIRQHSRKGAK